MAWSDFLAWAIKQLGPLHPKPDNYQNSSCTQCKYCSPPLGCGVEDTQPMTTAGECHRKSIFFYNICKNTTTSIKCCRGVTGDYPSCTIMSALLPLQRIAGVSLLIVPFFFAKLCLHKYCFVLSFFAQLFLHKYYYIYNVLQKYHKKINFLHKYFLIYRAFFYWSLKVSLAVLGFKYTYLPKVPWFPPITSELGN